MIKKGETIIEVKNLNKIFKIPKKSKNLSWMKKRLSWVYREWEEKIAVKDINLNIKSGEILGYLGPNGAGKSTTIKMLTGILHPTSGEVSVLGGLSPFEDRTEYTQNIGVVFGQRSILAYDIAVKDSFRLFKAIYGLSEEFYQSRLNYLIEMLEIDEFFETPYRMLSLGEKMRCELAASFLHKPSIVFLDEPTIGLDANAKITIRNFLKHINEKENVTIMITTHDMDDIEELCNRIILIDKGDVAYSGNLDNFKEKYSNWKRINVHYREITKIKKFESLKSKFEFEQKSLNDCSFKIPLKENLGSFLSELIGSVDLIDLQINEPKLENIVAKMYDKVKEEKKQKQKLSDK